MTTPIRTDQAEVTVLIDKKGKNSGQFKIGPMVTYSGAELAASNSKTRAGGMGQEFDVGGQASRTDASMTIEWSEEILGSLQQLETRVGKAKTTIITQWLDREGDAIDGATDTEIGILKSVSKPAYDGNGNAVGMMTITVGMHEQAA